MGEISRQLHGKLKTMVSVCARCPDETAKDSSRRLRLVFDSSSPIFDVSPYAMGRDSSASWNSGATSSPLFPLIR